jgi:hypothetical protein
LSSSVSALLKETLQLTIKVQSETFFDWSKPIVILNSMRILQEAAVLNTQLSDESSLT